jgi:hypothetical protein
MKRNASITKKKAEPVEADAEYDGKKVFYGSPFGVLIIDDKGMTVREPSPSGEPVLMPSKRKYRG